MKKNAVVSVEGAESKGEAATFFEIKPAQRSRRWLLAKWALYVVAAGLLLVLLSRGQ